MLLRCKRSHCKQLYFLDVAMLDKESALGRLLFLEPRRARVPGGELGICLSVRPSLFVCHAVLMICPFVLGRSSFHGGGLAGLLGEPSERPRGLQS